MGQQAHVSSEILESLLAEFQDCASSVASLRGEIDGHIGSRIAEGTEIVNKLIELENKAQIRQERASQLYYSCMRRRKYDKESDEYRPSCECEERDMKNAEKDAYEARERRENAQFYLAEMNREIGYFNDQHGGGGMMDSIVNDYVPEATQRLMALKEKVDRYETLEQAGVDIGDTTTSTPILESPHSSAAASFSRGSERLRQKMEQNKAIFNGYCSKCNCCPCQCNRLLELMRQRTR